VIPKYRPNQRVRWLWSAKPARAAASTPDRPYRGGVSDLDPAPTETRCGGVAVTDQPVRQELAGRDVVLGTRGLTVSRTLPHRDRRMVGAWCFVDRYGPEDIGGTPGMRVAPHPHTGLQTVSWLVDGAVLHRDSLGSLAEIHPGHLGLMTAGRAIAHSEESPPAAPPVLHGVQLWVALPDAHRHTDPSFEHHTSLPVLASGGVTARVLLGDLGGTTSPATAYSPIVGAELVLAAGAATELPLRPDFEHAVLALSGSAVVDGAPLPVGPLRYLGRGRSTLPLRAAGPVSAAGPARLMLLGGEPFEEELVMWWNFVGRGHDEIVAFRDDWQAHRSFGEVHGYAGDRLPAPPLPATRLRPRGREPRR
jgi:redox-sensitive bicupin YhaK (pirin superfamily)